MVVKTRINVNRGESSFRDVWRNVERENHALRDKLRLRFEIGSPLWPPNWNPDQNPFSSGQDSTDRYSWVWRIGGIIIVANWRSFVLQCAAKLSTLRMRSTCSFVDDIAYSHSPGMNSPCTWYCRWYVGPLRLWAFLSDIYSCLLATLRNRVPQFNSLRLIIDGKFHLIH